MVSYCQPEAARLKPRYLVGLMGGSSSNLALVARGKLSEVAVVVTLPVETSVQLHTGATK